MGQAEDDDWSSAAFNHCGRLQKPVDQVAQYVDHSKEELELLEDRKLRRTGVQASYELRQPNRTDGRCVKKISFILYFFMIIKSQE